MAHLAGTEDEAHERLGSAKRIILTCADPGMTLTELVADTERCVGRPAPGQPYPPRLAEPLSQREGEILRWLNSQLSLREIAGELSVSYDTVKTHTRHIYRKLGVSTRQQAVARARSGHVQRAAVPVGRQV
jgi:LuxR family maltose regulon positive regulatory protein